MDFGLYSEGTVLANVNGGNNIDMDSEMVSNLQLEA